MPHAPRMRFLRGSLHLNVALLAIVFTLGMLVNLYLAFPSNLPAQFAMRLPMVQAHMIVASLTLLVGAAALVLSVIERHTAAIVASGLGLALAATAYGAGMSFVNTGYQNGASLLMALGFIGALLAYGAGAYLIAPARTRRA